MPDGQGASSSGQGPVLSTELHEATHRDSKRLAGEFVPSSIAPHTGLSGSAVLQNRSVHDATSHTPLRASSTGSKM